MTERGRNRWVGPALGLLTLVGVMAGLHVLGRDALAAPPLASLEALQDWAEVEGPVTVAMVALRLSALAVGYHLIATTALALVGRVMRWPGVVGLADAATLPVFRGTVRRVAGIGLSASAMLATPLQSVGATPGHPAHQVTLADHGTIPAGAGAPADDARTGSAGSTGGPVTMGRRPTPPPSGSVTLHRSPPDDPDPGAGQATMRLEPSDRPAPGAGQPGGEVAPSDGPVERSEGDRATPTRHRVVPGDHLWGIAEARLAEELGRSPHDHEVEPYWRAIIASNPQLVDPDLIFPGSEVSVPPPSVDR